MADGLVARYAASGVPPPAVLYTDRECCGPDGSMFNRFFHAWRDMKVRKDIWHFMGRLAEGYTSVHHDQYHSFWPQLSTCIFSYDESDMNRLVRAKRNTLLKNNSSTSAITTSRQCCLVLVQKSCTTEDTREVCLR